MSIIAFVFAGETEINRFLTQPSQHTDEYNAMVKSIIEKSKRDKLNGVDVAEEDMIHVHIVSHSHDDVGFLKTLDQYYSGSQDMVIRAGVQYILDETIQHLLEDPAKKFTYVEMAFFMRWWRNQDQEMKDKVIKLVNDGQLEFINGGWSMNDEATTHYEDIITNMQKGHKFLLDNFGVTPNIGWHIDPFGHSSAQAAIFSRMGFDAWYISRIDYRDKLKRREDKNLEFLWTPMSGDRQNDDSIFVHTTYDMYWGIPNFYFDDTDAEEPIIEGYNLEERLEEFAGWVIRLNDTFKTNHILVPMGGDFNYQNAHTVFMNLDKLIKYFNQQYSGMKVFYSTPGEYMKNVIEDTKQEWNVNKDDFFPYADDQFSYWTGFYTSRSNQKGYIRQASTQLMAANQFLALKVARSGSVSDSLNDQEILEDAVSIAQHHDAATGTSRQAVADDYIDYLYTGIKASEKAEIESLKSLYSEHLDWQFCDITNATHTSCAVIQNLSQGKNVAVTITNPSSMARANEVVRVKVPPYLRLRAQDILFPSLDIWTDLVCFPVYTYEGYVDSCDLFILIPSINPFSTRTFIISKRDKAEEVNSGYDDFTIGFNKMSDSRLRVLYGRCYKSDCEDYKFDMEYKAYDSYEGEGQKSGMYIFRDDNQGAGSQPYNIIQDFTSFIGRAVSVINIKGDKIDTQVIIYNLGDIQSSTVISRVKGIDSEHGKEITLNFYRDDIETDRFYTDSNGMVMEERVLNHRNNYSLTNLTGFEAVSNFYPVNAAVTLRTNNTDFYQNEQFTVLTDRAQAASSLHSGEIEFLIDRRTYFDDNRGVGEPLNETIPDGRPIIVQTYHHVISAPVSLLHNKNYMETKKLQRCLFEEPLQILISDLDNQSISKLKTLRKEEDKQKYGYIGSLPPSLKIVTKALSDNKIMIRFYNMNEEFDGISKFLTVDLSGVLGDLLELRAQTSTSISLKISEWNLSLNQQAGNIRKIDWQIKDGKATYNGRKSANLKDENILYLSNQEMRSFIVEFGQDLIKATV